jgi:RNA polymerase sigma-70 factor (ECF subfamily)
VLNVPVGTVMSRLHRARKKIRQQLRRVGVAPTHADLEFGRAP